MTTQTAIRARFKVNIMAYTVFNSNNHKDHTTANMFLDDSGTVTMQRYDTLKYRQFDKLTDKQLGFFWRPEEVDIFRDAKDFKDLTEHEQHIFTSNLKRQILLDSVQGRSPNVAFLPIVSLPEVETWIETWAFSETIHSRSYTHIIRNIYSDPGKVFDEMKEMKEIMNCAESISKNYDDLIQAISWYNLLGEGTHTVNGKKLVVDLYAIKKKLWLAIMSVNILEGVRFYVSFACSWAFAELKKMEGNAKIIKLIARDENVHLAGTQHMLKILPQDDPDFAKIAEETKGLCTEMFMDAIQQEKDWADYLFRDGSMIGLNADLLKQYVEWIAAKRMKSIGLEPPFKPVASHPLPWTQKWISGAEVQVAPQETEISSYIIGGTKQDVNENTFKGLSL
jgi:ribonucleoside-diphosphate reductase beta chain